MFMHVFDLDLKVSIDLNQLKFIDALNQRPKCKPLHYLKFVLTLLSKSKATKFY